MRFEIFIAARYLRAKRRQAVIGVITLISVIGVAAGVASLIVALAITNGFRQDLQNQLLGSTSHINLVQATQHEGISDWKNLMAIIAARVRMSNPQKLSKPDSNVSYKRAVFRVTRPLDWLHR